MPTLSWLGDSAVRTAARRVPYRILEPVETVGDCHFSVRVVRASLCSPDVGGS